RAAILEDLVVLPSHRGSGGGTILLNAAVEEARRQGCKRITLLTDHDNMGARKFYERNGFYLSSMVPYRFML
ncbi:MAG TPA: GNAT family N-acetyltransferase, partial [Candidatus Methylacidiphilales bacterium]|nr:GNAT family N-acetyltransferase [Candidatus Methylacidiphilales bacterium]